MLDEIFRASDTVVPAVHHEHFYFALLQSQLWWPPLAWGSTKSCFSWGGETSHFFKCTVLFVAFSFNVNTGTFVENLWNYNNQCTVSKDWECAEVQQKSCQFSWSLGTEMSNRTKYLKFFRHVKCIYFKQAKERWIIWVAAVIQTQQMDWRILRKFESAVFEVLEWLQWYIELPILISYVTEHI